MPVASETNKRTRSDQGDLKVGSWKVEGRLATAHIEGRGPAFECGGRCCLHGVYAALGERDLILEYADRIRAAMDETQTGDTSEWFEVETHEDDDYPGGRCVGTRVHNDKCVFLNREGLCSLQLLEPELDLPEGTRLKPFYCRLFPLTTWGKQIEFDDMCDGVRPCCTLVAEGERRALDAWEYEFKEILGENGYRELRRVAPIPPSVDDRQSHG